MMTADRNPEQDGQPADTQDSAGCAASTLLGSSGFVFLDDSRWPYLLREEDDGEWWLYYWQNGTKSWTTVRPADKEWVDSLRDRALPPEQAALYLPNAGGMARELAAQDSDNSNDING